MRSGSRPGRREDVDEPAAHGELAALLDALDALVARRRELLGERVDARLVAAARPGALRAALRRAAALGDGGRRRADEPAALEHVERAGPLADEVRRRLEPDSQRTPRDGNSATCSSPRNHAGRLGGVARVGVLRAGARSSPRPSSSCSAASTSGSTGSETRARVGSAAANS